MDAYQEVKGTLDRSGGAYSIPSNQTKFPLCSFATAPSICHISDCDHRICKNTEQFLAPASNPPVPWTPYGVKSVCISPPGNQVISFSLIYRELLPGRKAFIGRDLWEGKEKGVHRGRSSREREEKLSAGSLGGYGKPICPRPLCWTGPLWVPTASVTREAGRRAGLSLPWPPGLEAQCHV